MIKANGKFKKLKLVKLTNLDFLNSRKIDFKLFNDTLYNFAINKLRKLDSVSYSFSSHNGSNFFSCVIRNGEITGTIQVNNKQYSIIPLGDSLHAIIEVDYSKLKPEASPIIIENKNQMHKSSSVQSTGQSTIDVLVAYTPAAANAVSDIVGLIQNAITSANSSFTADDIDIEYNLVHTMELNYSEGTKTMNQILSDFRTNTTIQNVRNEYSADLCFLVTNRDDISGIAYLLENPSGQSDYAYAVANYNRVRDTYTLAHETGHNLGAKHDTLADNSPGYNHGFRYTSGQWCTIMSYYTTETRQNFWSDPYKTYQGVTRGNTTYADNERKLNENRSTVASFREPQLSGTLTHNETIAGRAYTISSDFTVASGVTLTISPGATLTFGSNVKLTINGGGTLTANSVTYKGNGTAGSWNSIWFSNGSGGSIQSCTIRDAQCGVYGSNASVTVSNSTITNNSLYGFSLLSNTSGTISNCTISNNGTGINIYSSPVTISGNTFTNNFTHSINANNISGTLYWHDNTFSGNGSLVLNNVSSSLWLYGNFISQSSGVYVTSGFPNFANPSNQLKGYNAITCAGSPLLKADNYSTVYMGYDYDGGYNSIFGSDMPDMWASNHSGVYADNNYWGGHSPAIYADGTSWILARTPLSTDPNPGSSCSGMNAPLAKTAIEANTAISDKYWQALSDGQKGDYSTAKDLLEEIINGSYDSKYSPLALLALYEFKLIQSNAKSPDNSVIIGWTNTVNTLNSSSENSLRPFALRLLARDAALSNDTTKMLRYDKEIVKNYPGNDNELASLYDLVLYYSEIGNNSSLADKYFSRMKEAYPDGDLTFLAETELGVKSDLKMNKKVTTSDIPKENVLNNAYPNPFNPTTTIKYQLPRDGFVTLKIYDMLGREVKTLVSDYKTSGKYSVSFDASELASGTYFYQLRAGNFISTKKMLLLK